MKRTKADEAALEQGCYYDVEQAERPIRFAERFFRSQFIRGKLTLLAWQADFLRYVYGWRLPNGNRRFRLANLHTPKKSGKTLLVSLVSFYELLASGEPSPFVVSAAPSRENAGQVYDELSYALKHSPFKNYVNPTPHIKRLKIADTNSEFRSLASDGNRVHGYNASAVIIDECAWHKSAGLWNALRYATDARPNGITVLISTAGEQPEHWYHSVYEKSKRILAGDDLDITHAAFIYEHDKSKPIDDEAEWLKANPSIGTAFPLDQFRRDFLAAKSAGVGEFLNFQRLKLNRWVRPEEAAWLDTSDYANHVKHYDELELRKHPAAIGIDLSEAGDPSSVSIVWQLPNSFHVQSWAYVCEEGISRRQRASNLPHYEEWLEEGSLHKTPGDMIDSRAIRNHVLTLCAKYDVRSVNFDPRGAYVVGQEVAEEGYDTLRIPQSFRYYTPLLNEFGKAYREGRITHTGSSWLRYCLANVRVEANRYQEVRPYRKASVDHIDGAIATLLAFHTHIAEPLSSGGVFLVG